MVTAHILDLQEVYRSDFASADRQLWRSTVADVAKRAKAAMDSALHGRIDKAQAIVLAGDIALHDDGTATVASQSDGSAQYQINGRCECRDAAKALEGWCKHRLALGIAKRVQQALAIAEERMVSEEPPDEPPGSVSEQPPAATHHTEAPASVNCYVTLAGRQVQITLRDSDEQRLLARLAALLQQYPMPEAPQAPKAETHGEGWCKVHGLQMRSKTNERGSWWFHKVGEGWCHGK